MEIVNRILYNHNYIINQNTTFNPNQLKNKQKCQVTYSRLSDLNNFLETSTK